jgi:hypothetical protein
MTYDPNIDPLHKLLLSKPQKMTKELDRYKSRSTVNVLFNGIISYNDFVITYGKMTEDENRYKSIEDGSQLINVLEDLKNAYVSGFNLKSLDNSFTNKLSKTVTTYRAGEDVSGHFLGYTSTSLCKNISFGFLYTGAIFYIITILKGTPYIYLEMELGESNIISNYPYQFELLLPRGATYSTQKSAIKRIKNPNYTYEKVNPYIDVLYKWITITGFEPVEPKLKITL